MAPAVSATGSDSRSLLKLGRGWIVYALGWVALAILWSVAAAISSNVSPIRTLWYGFVLMGTAGVMGVGVWWLTGKLAWDRHSFRFYATHAICCVLYAAGYTAAVFSAEALEGNFRRAFASAWRSPILGWNVLMGSWLYLIVVGLSYAIRTQQRLTRQAAAEAEARMLAERAQLTALRARLNPHFLFNALHTVSSLVTTDPIAADEAIDRLGGLLRYALDESADDVPLHREWAFTRDYLAFEQLRLGERLRVCEALEESALGCNVPLLVLQPLVENAVRHAIAPRAEGGTIRVAANVRAGTLTLSVEDDGPGVTKQRCDDGRGVGLSALKRRLEVRYGADATVDIQTAPGAGFSVKVAIPVDTQVQAGAA
jgi:signal transduction histidine kinase